MNLNADLERDIAELAKLLETLPKEFRGEVRKEVLTEAAQPIVQAARAKAPVSDQFHYRYSTPKVAKRMRAPKGMGRVVATYMSGNLWKSIRVLNHGRFKKSSSVFIGPKAGSGKGTFGASESRVDAYYAAMIERGTARQKAQPYMRPAFDETKDQAFDIARRGFGKRLDDWTLKNKK